MNTGDHPYQFRLAILSGCAQNLALYGRMPLDGITAVSRALAIGERLDMSVVTAVIGRERRAAKHAIAEARAVLASLNALEAIATREAGPARRLEREAEVIAAREAGEE